MIHSSWPDWGWELKETIKSGLTTIQKFRLTITNSDKIFSEDAVVWIVLNSQNQISKCEIYFDATQLSQIKKVITTREDPRLLRQVRQIYTEEGNLMIG